MLGGLSFRPQPQMRHCLWFSGSLLALFTITPRFVVPGLWFFPTSFTNAGQFVLPAANSQMQHDLSFDTQPQRQHGLWFPSHIIHKSDTAFFLNTARFVIPVLFVPKKNFN
jgi:hypothetical protein